MLSLTQEQRAAIECRQHSVALSAGAGCGKTFVLTQRFISHLDVHTYPESINTRLSQLIAITFTDAAAREMRSRIRQACYDRLHQADNAESQQHWLRHLREIDAARISTIHAFCTSLLRSHSAQAGLDPTFGVLDQPDADVLQFDVIDDVLRKELANLDEATLDLAAAFGLARLKDQVAELLNHRQEPAFQTWQRAAPDEVLAAWRDWHATHALPNAVAEIAVAAPIASLIHRLETLDVPPKKDKLRDARAALLQWLPRLQSTDATLTDSDLEQIREAAKVSGVCTAKDWPDGEYGGYRDACKELRDLIDKHLPQPFNADAARETARLGLELLKLTAKIVAVYDDRKRAQGKLDFDDLLAKAHALLNSPENADLRQNLSEDLQLLLVDEFQDTDELQVDLVRNLCGAGFDAGRLFFVGDFKQSIYRFRGAVPTVFRNLRGQVNEAGRLPLTENFRSQPEILHFVNALFCDQFTGYEALRPKREQLTARPAIEFLWTITPDKNNRRIPGAVREARKLEAKAIALRLRSLLDESSTEQPVVDKVTKKPRRLELGDVAILFRTLGDVQVYEEALREYGLDYYLVGGYAFYAQQEIFDVLNLLRAAASTADEVSLAGVLRSPFFALADETLFWLHETEGSLNAGLFAQERPSQLSPEEAARVAAAAATISHLRAIKDRVPIAALLTAALDRTGYDAALLGEFLGERKLANLHKLVERARLADQSGAIDLDGFITQLSQFISREPKESLAATLPEAANVIRLMTIHHAKGLEFPFVIIPDLDRQPLLRAPSAALHAELGPLVPQPPDDENDNVTTGMSLYAALERREELDERERMLYVACTRAADYLMLSTSVQAYNELRSDWMELLAERFNLADGKLIAELPPDYARPQVRVTTDPQTDHKPVATSRGPDLLKLLDEAHAIAAAGNVAMPPEVAPIPVDRSAQRQFSFSRLTGQLIQTDENERRTQDRSPEREQRNQAEPLLAPGAPSQRNLFTSHIPGKSGVSSDVVGNVDHRGLGTLVHEVLERIDFAPGATAGSSSSADVSAWCEHLAPFHVIHNVVQSARLATAMIERFVASPRGRELASAKAIHREIDFLLAWPPDAPNPDGQYIQGVIDCLYQDAAGDWHILDFKTNDVSAERIAEEAERYELQLQVYAIAVERALRKSPKELVLRFLTPGVEYTIFWNDAARNSAISQLTEAIDAMRGSPDAYVVRGSPDPTL
jgi:ATP-dependent helicase/nuclease subunit A